MGVLGGCFKLVFFRILPVFVAAIAVFIGWACSTDIPDATIFATIIPLFMGGRLPTTIFGDWATPGTPPVPADKKAAPRPAGEMFLPMPSGAQMPANGLGMCCRWNAYDAPSAYNAALWFLLEGGRHIDGAEIYLNSPAIGDAMQEAMRRGVPRSEIFIVTKLVPRFYGEGLTEDRVAKMLADFKVDYLDLVLLHNPVKMIPLPGAGPNCAASTWAGCRAEAWTVLSRLQKQGKIRDVGVSNFDGPQIAALQALNVAHVATNQFNWNPWAHGLHAETAEYCLRNNVTVTAHTPVGDGLRVRGPSGTTHSGWPALEQLAAKYKRSQTQIILRWELQRGVAIIPGSGNPKHIKENLEVYSFHLTDEEMDVITAFKDDARAKKMMFQPIGALLE